MGSLGCEIADFVFGSYGAMNGKDVRANFDTIEARF
jgi:hypothetical protein